MKSQLQTVGVSLASAVIGALVVVSYQARQVERHAPGLPAPVPASPPVEVRLLASGGDPQLALRLAALEKQVAERGEPKPGAVEEPPIDPAEAEARSFEEREQRDATFAAQPLDRGWAADAARSFQTELQSFDGGSFRAGPVDCRTSLCRAQLTWDSYELARAEAKKVVEHGYATNCAKELFTPEPEGAPGSPYTANLYFDCANLRRKAN